MKQVNAKGAPPAIGPYSHAVVTKNLIFLSGQIPIDPDTGELISADISNQTKQVIKNISAILAELDKSFLNIVKTTCFLTDMSNFAIFNKIYERAFISSPARSCVEVKELPKKALVEIELIVEA